MIESGLKRGGMGRGFGRGSYSSAGVEKVVFMESEMETTSYKEIGRAQFFLQINSVDS
jgi:hypothetical protein